MGWLAFDCYCKECGHAWEDLERLSLEEIKAKVFTCPVCNQEAGAYKVSAPEVRTDSNSTTYLDGTKRAGFAEMREANLLRKEVRSKKKEDQARAQTEINRLKGVKSGT